MRKVVLFTVLLSLLSLVTLQTSFAGKGNCVEGPNSQCVGNDVSALETELFLIQEELIIIQARQIELLERKSVLLEEKCGNSTVTVSSTQSGQTKKDEVDEILENAASFLGMNKEFLEILADKESKRQPSVVNGDNLEYVGLFQITKKMCKGTIPEMSCDMPELLDPTINTRITVISLISLLAMIDDLAPEMSQKDKLLLLAFGWRNESGERDLIRGMLQAGIDNENAIAYHLLKIMHCGDYPNYSDSYGLYQEIFANVSLDTKKWFVNRD